MMPLQQMSPSPQSDVFVALAGAVDTGEIIRTDGAASATVVDAVERLATVCTADVAFSTGISTSETIGRGTEEETFPAAARRSGFGVVTRCTVATAVGGEVTETDLAGRSAIGTFIIGTALTSIDANTAAAALAFAIAANAATHQFEWTAAFLANADRAVGAALTVTTLLSCCAAFASAGVTVTYGTTASDIGGARFGASRTAAILEGIAGVTTTAGIGTWCLTGAGRRRRGSGTGGATSISVRPDDGRHSGSATETEEPFEHGAARSAGGERLGKAVETLSVHRASPGSICCWLRQFGQL